VLTELCDQGEFSCAGRGLERNMLASQFHIPWRDYYTIDAGRVARNKLAHQALLLPKSGCLKFINAIGLELHLWKII
jgi:hypothetical protein